MVAPTKGDIENAGELKTAVDTGDDATMFGINGLCSINPPVGEPPDGKRKADGLKVRSPGAGPAPSFLVD